MIRQKDEYKLGEDYEDVLKGFMTFLVCLSTLTNAFVNRFIKDLKGVMDKIYNCELELKRLKSAHISRILEIHSLGKAYVEGLSEQT